MVAMDASWYLNHGEHPNVRPYTPDSDATGAGGPGFNAYRTTRHVHAGEELLLDYRDALPGVFARFGAGAAPTRQRSQ